MVNSGRGMTTERAIPDLWEVFGSRGSNGSGGGGLGIRRNSWQKMQAQLSEEERAVTELFNDLHLQLESPGDHSPDPKKNSSSQRKITTEAYNERNSSNVGDGGVVHNNFQHIEKHLSMKKTIRKKMMRDLQQAFLDQEDPCQLVDKAHKADGQEPNLLDMLKDPIEPCQAAASTAAPATNKKPGFWKKLTMRKSKR